MILKIKLWNCEKVWRDLAEILNAERCAKKAGQSCSSREELSNEYLVFTCKNQRRYSRKQASQSLSKISQKLEYELEKT